MSGARSGGGYGEGSVASDGRSDPMPQQLVRGKTTQTAEDDGEDEDAELLEQWRGPGAGERWHRGTGGVFWGAGGGGCPPERALTARATTPAATPCGRRTKSPDAGGRRTCP